MLSLSSWVNFNGFGAVDTTNIGLRCDRGRPLGMSESWLVASPSTTFPPATPGLRPRIGERGRHSTARVSVVSVKDIRVAGTGDCGVRRMLPTRAGDKPPRYIPPSPRRDSGRVLGYRAGLRSREYLG